MHTAACANAAIERTASRDKTNSKTRTILACQSSRDPDRKKRGVDGNVTLLFFSNHSLSGDLEQAFGDQFGALPPAV